MATAKILLKADTTANWESSNRVLSLNELGIERKTDGSIDVKLGDGTTPWNSLAYMLKEHVRVSVVSSTPSATENSTLYIVEDTEHTAEKIIYVDSDGTSHEVTFGVDSDDIDVGGESLTEKITSIESNITTLSSASHTHSNKSVLDGITSQKVSGWDLANTNNHTHTNKTALDGITEDKIEKWDNSIVDILDNLTATGAQSVTMTDGSENRIGEVSSLTLTLPSPIPDDYISILSFTSGATATALDYGENIKWVNGSTDVIDGIFVPIPNTRYTIVIRYDGQYVCGEVGGVAIEQTTD